MKVKFTDPNKWSDKWFRSLTPNQKLLWLYLIDNCDIAGLIEVDYDYISFHLGISSEDVREAMQGLHRGYLGATDGSDWIWIINYIKVQRNLPLNPESNNAHKGIVNSLLFQSQRFEMSIIEEKLGAKEGLLSPPSKVKVEYSYIESVDEKISELETRWKLPDNATAEQKEIELAVQVYKTYCDIYGKRAYEEILARDWIGKVRKIPADIPEKIPDVLRYAKKFNTFGYTRAANIDYLVTDWASFRADAERAYLNNNK